MYVIRARNINEAYPIGLMIMELGNTNIRTPEGKATTIEYNVPVANEYKQPDERVLFDPVRNANPFFHLMESLWILAGRKDVEWLARFNRQMENYSDDGTTFHAAYGHRMINHFCINQLHGVIDTLSQDMGSRQAVVAIWDPREDLDVKSKDIPCNDMVFAKIRNGKLTISVLCRSNDIIWGCYGTNVVQFSMVQEYLACALGVGLGSYVQFSDSFHYYPDNEATARVLKNRVPGTVEISDPYVEGLVRPFRLMNTDPWAWEVDLYEFMSATEPRNLEDGGVVASFHDPFFSKVAAPMFIAHTMYKTGTEDSASNAMRAANYLADEIESSGNIDWLVAGKKWLDRIAAKRKQS